MLKSKMVKQALCTFFYLTIGLFGYAQKLPNKQSGLIAPPNTKVDGKANEWVGITLAHNSATDVFYTVANDDSNLYLIVQAKDADIINKIYRGGLTFTINPFGKKNNKGAVAITYPVIDSNTYSVNLSNKPKIVPGSAGSVMKADSFMKANNKLMNARAKQIKVTGIKGIDTLISIYNEDGIKAAALFNNEMVYTLEMSIPLKYLNVAANDANGYAFQIQLHAIGGRNWDNVAKSETIGPDGKTILHIDVGRMNNSQLLDHLRTINSPTDFWGEYTLAKKP